MSLSKENQSKQSGKESTLKVVSSHVIKCPECEEQAAVVMVYENGHVELRCANCGVRRAV